jgi:Tfp pilus assembly protein PilX
MTSFRSRMRDLRTDRGVALATVMLTILVISGFAATVATVSINNMQNSNSDREAGSALGAADAGVAQAIEYLRSNGVAGLTCAEANVSTCTGQAAGFASPTSPKTIALNSSGTGCTSTTFKNCAKVYITYVTRFAPPTVKTGIYAIHSAGTYGTDPGSRNVVVTVSITPDTYPVGVFGQNVSGNGGTAVYTESLFTLGCVSSLDSTGNLHGNGTSFSGIDSYWDQPAAAHSTAGLSTGNNSSCPWGDNSAVPTGTGVHGGGSTANAANCPNNTVLNGDQSWSGGLVSPTAGSQCYREYTRSNGTFYPDGVCPAGAPASSTQPDGLCDTTLFTTADLQRYGYRPRGLSDTQYQALKARAQANGTYNLASGSIGAALSAAVTNGINDPVLYWDCNAAGAACSGGGISIHGSDFPAAFQTAPSTTSCTAGQPIVTIVVENGSITFQGGNNTWLDAAVFVPDGSFNGNGGYNLYGTLFSNNLSLGGNQTFQLDNCWLTNFPGAVLNVTQKSFREDDLKGG